MKTYAERLLQGPITITRRTADAFGLNKAAIIDYLEQRLSFAEMENMEDRIGDRSWVRTNNKWSGLSYIPDSILAEAVEDLVNDGIFLRMQVPGSNTTLYSIDYDVLKQKVLEAEA